MDDEGGHCKAMGSSFIRPVYLRGARSPSAQRGTHTHTHTSCATHSTLLKCAKPKVGNCKNDGWWHEMRPFFLLFAATLSVPPPHPPCSPPACLIRFRLVEMFHREMEKVGRRRVNTCFKCFLCVRYLHVLNASYRPEATDGK